MEYKKRKKLEEWSLCLSGLKIELALNKRMFLLSLFSFLEAFEQNGYRFYFRLFTEFILPSI